MAVERTLILIKPDAFERGLSGDILGRIERRGFGVVAGKLLRVSRELGEKHYAEHAEKPFFESLLEFITSGPVAAMVVEGDNAIAAFRQLAGATNPVQANNGSIRGDFALEVQYNIVHGSDSPESAKREIDLWFPGV